MLTLTEFLLARIAEDERGARHHTSAGFDYGEPAERAALMAAQDRARPDPARVLAECEAKRRIVASCRPIDWRLLEGARPEIVAGYRLIEEQQALVLSALAMPYAAHPGYREEWKP